MLKEMVCINCPRGCHLTVEKNGDEVKVTGNACNKGLQFGKQELICPMRTISSTIKTNDPHHPVIPVRINKEIPKDKIFDVMVEINKITVTLPIHTGQILITNVASTGADIIATTSL